MKSTILNLATSHRVAFATPANLQIFPGKNYNNGSIHERIICAKSVIFGQMQIYENSFPGRSEQEAKKFKIKFRPNVLSHPKSTLYLRNKKNQVTMTSITLAKRSPKKLLLLFYLVEVKTPRVLRRTELKRAQVYDGLVSDNRLE